MKIKLEDSLDGSLKSNDSIKSPRDSMRRIRRKVKMRPLVPKVQPQVEPQQTIRTPTAEQSTRRVRRYNKKHVVMLIISILIAFSSSILYQTKFGRTLRCQYKSRLQKSYYQVVYGDNYCTNKLNETRLMKKMKESIVGQQDQLILLEGALKKSHNQKRFIPIILMGGTGVGKSLTVNLLIEEFPWKENINLLFWDLSFENLITDDNDHYDLELVSDKFSNCGFNLIIIEDIDLRNDTVARISTMERNLQKLTTRAPYKIILMPIFRTKPNQDFGSILYRLRNFIIVEYTPITKEIFAECLQLHRELLKIHLTQDEIDDYMQNTDYEKQGCKTIAKKLSSHFK